MSKANLDKRMKKTVIVGATPNPARYAFIAANMLKDNGYDIAPVGIKKGEAAGIPILNIRDKPFIEGVHTITLYVRPQIQSQWYNYLLSLNPERIIFNPGTENPEFEKLAREKGVETLEACTLVLIRTGQY